ncbi:MAG TPA: hypothetical protein VM261_34640 [Kofleriaceae bacterium]|nr:hypothetical protein [Kofleriaceae bacterium]
MTRPAALRTLLLAAAVALLAASASSRSSTPPPQPAGAWNAQPPQSQPMDPRAAVGLWKSTFGAVKIEPNEAGVPSSVHGAWTYDKQGAQVVGYFGGTLEGNVLRLTWREPAVATPGAPLLEGEGWLVFDPSGARFTGRWWTSTRDRQGDWSGWRGGQAAPNGVPQQSWGSSTPPPPVGGYGGAAYGGAQPAYPPPPPPSRY